MGDEELVAGGVKDRVAIGHPGGVVGEDVGDAEGAASVDGNDPEGLLGLGGEVGADEELQCVGRAVTEGWSGDLAGDGEGKRISGGDGDLREDGAALFYDGGEDAEAIGGGGGQALHGGGAGGDAAVVGDLRDGEGGRGLAGGSEIEAGGGCGGEGGGCGGRIGEGLGVGGVGFWGLERVRGWGGGGG